MNEIASYHLVMDVIDRVLVRMRKTGYLRRDVTGRMIRQISYTREHGDDPPEVRVWTPLH